MLAVTLQRADSVQPDCIRRLAVEPSGEAIAGALWAIHLQLKERPTLLVRDDLALAQLISFTPETTRQALWSAIGLQVTKLEPDSDECLTLNAIAQSRTPLVRAELLAQTPVPQKRLPCVLDILHRGGAIEQVGARKGWQATTIGQSLVPECCPLTAH